MSKKHLGLIVLVTLVLTTAFAYGALSGEITLDGLMSNVIIYTLLIVLSYALKGIIIED